MSANSQVVVYENELGQQVLPQVQALMQAGNVTAAKQLLQQGLAKYNQAIQQAKAMGGDLAKSAEGSLTNKALHNTIQSLSSSLGMSYTPGAGAIANQDDTQAKAALYGLGAPVNQGDPYALTPEKAGAPSLLTETGYDPKTLAQMHAKATEAPAAAGLQQMSQAKIALGQSGLAGSPAAAALRSTVARQTGQAQVAANRDVDLANATQGQHNQEFNANAKNANATQQNQYNWAAKQGNFDELNSRYRGAVGALAG